jgi:cation:H+ antiporter
MLSHVAILVISIIVLVKSADWFVEFAGRAARRLGVSDLVIGLTITSIGTSLPELASSVSASARGYGALAVGNVVGANIANIGLILGTAALVRPFATQRRMHDRDGFIMVAAAGLLFLAVLDNELGRFEALAFVLLYTGYVAFAAKTDVDQADVRFADFIDYFLDFRRAGALFRWRSRRNAVAPDADEPVDESAGTSRTKLLLELGAAALSCAAVVVSARFLVEEAVWAASQLGLPENVIGLTLIALGTTQPELVIAITAARRGNGDMVVGNVMGSNIANVLLVLGLAGTVNPLEVPESSVVQTIPMLIFFSLGLLYLIKSGWCVTRRQGLFAVACYAAFIAATVAQGLCE